MIPTNIEFMSVDKQINLVAVSFNHIATVWQYDQYGVLFLNDLIHCDMNDPIKQFKFIDRHLLVAHANCLNVWHFKNSATTSEQLLANNANQLNISCVWSEEISQCLHMCVNPLNSSQIILFLKRKQNQLNEETSTEIQSRSPSFYSYI